MMPTAKGTQTVVRAVLIIIPAGAVKAYANLERFRANRIVIAEGWLGPARMGFVKNVETMEIATRSSIVIW